MCGHTSPISSLALSGDGRRVVSASEKDQSIRVWDLETGEQVLLIQGKEPHEFQKVCITADGLRAVSAGHRNLIGIMGGWNLETGVKIFENVFGYVIDGGRGLSLNADGSTALRIADQNLAVYDLAGGYVGAEYRDHMGPVTAVALAPNGTHAASGGRDRTLKVWDLDAQKKMGELSGHTHEISCVAIAQDGSMIVSGCEFDALRIWNLADMKQESEIDANNPLLEEWELTAKVKELYPILRDGGINDEVYHGKLRDRIWKWNIGRSDGTKKSRADRKLEAVLETIDWNAIDHSHIMLTENARGVARIALTHDGRYAVCVDFAADVETPRVWSLDLRTSQPTSTFIGHSGQEIEGPVILADDKRVVTGGHAGELHVWNLKNGEGLKKLLFPKRLRVGGFAVTAKGDRAIVFYRVGFQQTKDTAIRVWNLNKGREEFVLEGHTSEISGVAITPDGHRAVSVGGGGILNVWDLNAGTLIATIETEKMAGSFLSITDDGRWAISGWGRDNSIRVWDLEYACQAAAYFTSAPIMRMASSSSGYALAVGCSDGQVHFLNLRTDSTSSSRTDGQRSKSLFGRLFGVGRVETPSRSTEETASDRSAVTAISAVTVFCACVYSMIIIDGEEDDGEMLILSRAVPDATLINQGIKYYRDHGLEHLLKEVGGILNEDQKRCLMVNLIAVALEDGRLRTKEQELLEQFRQALNISEADYQRTHEILLRKANLTVLAEPVDGEVPALTLFCASLLGMAAADADFDATEKEYVKRLVANPDALQEGADYFSQAGIDTVVKGAGLHLNEEQKLCLMSNLMALAMADGLLRGVEQQLVERFREALHINEEDYSAMHEVLMVLRNYSVFG